MEPTKVPSVPICSHFIEQLRSIQQEMPTNVIDSGGHSLVSIQKMKRIGNILSIIAKYAPLESTHRLDIKQ